MERHWDFLDAAEFELTQMILTIISFVISSLTLPCLCFICCRNWKENKRAEGLAKEGLARYRRSSRRQRETVVFDLQGTKNESENLVNNITSDRVKNAPRQ